MRKLFAMAALVAAIFAAVAALTTRADALAISAPAGLIQAVDVTAIEQVRWHHHHHRWHHYHHYHFSGWGWPWGYYYYPAYRPVVVGFPGFW
jgi:hypothetical protein